MNQLVIAQFEDLVEEVLINKGISQGPAGINGTNGTNGINGTNGTNGQSAYQLWLSAGNVGNVTDYLNSLKGTDGTNGTSVTITGIVNNVDNTITITFSDGTAHTTGVMKGVTGNTGAAGATGAKGDTGTSAYEEAVLTSGFIGSKSAWLNSLKGTNGIDGVDGADVTILGIVNNVNGTLTITFSDGTVHTTQSLIGATGATGATGAKGVQGDIGTSAYQQAVLSTGFVGTESQWISSLSRSPETIEDLNVLADGRLQLILSNSNTVTTTNSIVEGLTLSDPVPVTVGGVAAGTVYTNAKIVDVLKDLLNPYQTPTFTSFNINRNALLEIGEAFGLTDFTWSTSNSANIANGIVLKKGSTILEAGNNDGLYQYDGTGLIKSTASSETFTISGVDTEGTTFSRSLTVNWGAYIYSGEAGATIDETGIKGLRVAKLAIGSSGNYAMIGGNYKWICYPTSMGVKSTFKDAATNFDVAMNPAIQVYVTSDRGALLEYTCHRSYNQMAAGLTIIVS